MEDWFDDCSSIDAVKTCRKKKLRPSSVSFRFDAFASPAPHADSLRQETHQNQRTITKTKKSALQITKGEKVTVAGFGTFERRERPERSGRNPRTGEALTIAARSAPAFVAAKALKEQVDGGGEKK